MNILDYVDEKMSNLYFQGKEVIKDWDASADPTREELPRVEMDLVDIGEGDFTTQSNQIETFIFNIYFYAEGKPGLSFIKETVDMAKLMKRKIFSIYADTQQGIISIENMYKMDVGKIFFTTLETDPVAGFAFSVTVTFDTPIGG